MSNFCVKRQLLFFISLCSIAANAFAQKLPFQNFSVDKGLIQSQVIAITQDEQRHLWLGTFGGLDRFDGTSFRHFTKADGFYSTSVTRLYTAKNGFIWGTSFKEIFCYDGFKISNYPIQAKPGFFNFTSITESLAGEIWAFDAQKGLFVFRDKQFIKATLPYPGAIPTCLFKNSKGQLLVNFYKKGMFVYENKMWAPFSALQVLDSTEYIIALNDSGKDYYIFTNKKRLLKIADNKIVAENTLDIGIISAISFDNKKNIWIGCNMGVLIINEKDLSINAIYTAVSGLSDNLITNIYKDIEGNMWIATDGDGFFRYSGGEFEKFDNTNGLPGNVVMGIVRDAGKDLFIGTREKGLVKFSSTDRKITIVDYSAISKSGINSMGKDKDNNLFLGTMDSKLLKFNGNSFSQVLLDKRRPPFVNTILAGADRTWFATSSGCYYLQGDSVTKINGIDEIALGVMPVGQEETLIGGINGFYSVSTNGEAKKIQVPSLQNIETNCFSRYHGFILIGTADDGVYFWKRESGKVYKCNTSNGLSDNQVFGILVDSRDRIWIGAGSGIQQLFFDESNFSFRIKKFSRANGYERAEINLNAIAEDKDGHIWIGTTKGVFIFNQDDSVKNNVFPYTVIQHVSSAAFKTDSLQKERRTAWYNFPESPVLPYAQNNISFNVKGVFMKDPGSARYSYQLVGYDKAFSEPVEQSFFNYQNLEPGDYTFKVKAIVPGKTGFGNLAAYHFSVSTPFYKTKWFLLLLILGLIFIGILVQYMFTKARQRKNHQRALLRLEDQQKIRQRTSEDFHDELGNKLTRISLLADILQRKIGEQDMEKNGIIMQIKENVSELYAGTKDIIWSLSPVSDNLSEVLRRIQHFGEELFHDSDIEFECIGLNSVDTAIVLPMDWSRNIIMIFKEILNNSLRHSGCSKVVIYVATNNSSEISISLTDNGKGFDKNNIQKGNGMNNVKRRADRIAAMLYTESTENMGTMVTLTIKIPPGGG